MKTQTIGGGDGGMGVLELYIVVSCLKQLGLEQHRAVSQPTVVVFCRLFCFSKMRPDLLSDMATPCAWTHEANCLTDNPWQTGSMQPHSLTYSSHKILVFYSLRMILLEKPNRWHSTQNACTQYSLAVSAFKSRGSRCKYQWRPSWGPHRGITTELRIP